MVHFFNFITPTDAAWLQKHHLGWLANDIFLETTSILLQSIVIYIVGRLLIEWGVRHAIRSTAKHRSWHKKDIEKRENTLLQLFRSVWWIIAIAYFIAMVATRIFHINLSPLFASAGIIGVALGFGSQSLVKDFLSGVFIIAENQYRVGDIVDIMGASGTVERIGTRSTVIRDTEGGVHYIPNGTIQHVINKTMGYSVARFTLQIDPSADISIVTKTINSLGQKLAKEEEWRKKILEPPQFVSVSDITGRAIDIIIAGKTQPSDQWAVSSEMRQRILDAFEKKDIPLAKLPVSHSGKK